MTLNQPGLRRRSRGFTLIEMIGLLTIISVLAAVLIPRIFGAIDESRVSSTASNIGTLRSATITYFGRYGFFGVSGGVPLNASLHTNEMARWDRLVLLPEGLLEVAFGSHLGTDAALQVVASVPPSTSANSTNSAYNIDGNSATTVANEAGSGYVIQAVMQNVALNDARALNRILDGDDASLGEGATPGVDLAGRVKYDASSGVGTLMVYLAHK